MLLRREPTLWWAEIHRSTGTGTKRRSSQSPEGINQSSVTTSEPRDREKRLRDCCSMAEQAEPESRGWVSLLTCLTPLPVSMSTVMFIYDLTDGNCYGLNDPSPRKQPCCCPAVLRNLAADSGHPHQFITGIFKISVSFTWGSSNRAVSNIFTAVICDVSVQPVGCHACFTETGFIQTSVQL